VAKVKRLLTIVIDKCAQCPTTEYRHDGSKPLMERDSHFCLRLDPPKEIPTHLFSIPEWCPLPSPESK
jgi:hypothetical protein